MATYAIQGPAHAGAAVAMAAPGGTSGDFAPTGQGVGLLVQTTGTACTVSLPVAPTYDGLVVTTRTVVCPTTGLELIPLPSSVYGAGLTAVHYSAVSGVT